MNTNLPTTTGTKTSTKRESRRTTKFLQTTLLSALFFLLLGVGESWGQCGSYRANVACTTAAPTTLNSSISCTPPSNNGGRRNFDVTNMVAGCKYRVSNCASGFDTQLTIFNTSGVSVAFNDDNGPGCTGSAASIDFVPSASGTYWIQLNRYNCNSTSNVASGSITVTLIEIPTITSTGSLTAFSSCSGLVSSSQNFSISGANMYAGITITPPSGFEVSTSSTFASSVGTNASPLVVGAAGTIASNTIYVRLSNTATGTPSGNIALSSTGATTRNVAVSGTVNSNPTAVTVTGGAICSGGTITASGGTNGTIYWQGTTSGGTSTTSSGTTSPAITAAGTYYARAQSASGCWGTEGSAAVTITAVPSCIAAGFSPADANSSVNPAAGTTITWSAVSGATSYDVYFGTNNPPTNLVNGTNQSAVTYSTGALLENTTYYWKVVPKNSCGASSSCSIYSFTTTTSCTAPSILSTSTTNINCFGQSTGFITVNATGGTSPYQYSKDNGTTWVSSNVFGSLSSGSYSIVVKGGDGCIGAPSVVTLTQPLAALAVSASGGGSGCANATKTVSSTVSGGTSPYTYSWSNPSGLSSGTVASPTATIGSFASHTLTVTDNNGCTASSSPVSITNNSPAAPTASNPAAICAGQSTNILATSAGNGINWFENSTGGTVLNPSLLASGANYSVGPASTTIYYAEATSSVTSGSQTYDYSGSIVNWTVPVGVTSINVDARGAQGGTQPESGINYGGRGARIVSNNISVSPGQVLKILVGQMGVIGLSDDGAGGGGGTYLTTSTNVPLVVAGGGGGDGADAQGISASTTSTPSNNSYGNTGGTSTNGGTGYNGGAGGGLTGNGGNGTNGATLAGGGLSFTNGGTGGTGRRNGGFGGGGAGSSDTEGAGGGGGYAGGSGGNNTGSDAGGGGSSYSIVSPTTATATQTGNGQIIISWNAVAGCASETRTPVTVTVNAALSTPTAAVSGSSTINVGGTTTLTSTAGASTLWYTAETGGSSVGSGSPFTTAVQCTPGTITYYAEDNNGTCGSTRAAVTFTVRPIVASNPSNALICSTGGSVTLNTQLTGGSSITWAPSTNLSIASGSTTVASPTVTTQYTMNATVAGCGAVSGTQTVGVIDAVAFTPTSTPTAVCAGNPAVLASNLSSSGFTYATTTYSYSTAPVDATLLIDNGAAVTANPYTSTNTSYPLFDDAGWGNIPIPFAYNFFGENYDRLNIGTNGIVHFGTYSASIINDFIFTSLPNAAEPLNIIAVAANDNDLTGSGNGTLRYWTEGIAPTRRFVVEWSGASQQGSLGARKTTAQVKLFETTGNVEVHVSSSTSTNTKVVGLQNNDNPPIGAQAFSGTTTMSNQAWKFVPGANYSFQWATAGSNINLATSTGYTTPNLSTSGTVTYSVAATNPNTQCTTTKSVDITVNALPAAPNSTGDVTACSTAGSQSLTVTAGAGETADWYSTDSSTSILASGDNVLSYSTATAGTYYAAAQNTTTGCSSASRTAVTLNVNSSPAAPTVTTPVSYCQGATATALTATATGANTLNWYSAAPNYPAVTGATALGSAPTPSTSSAGTTNYYVSQSSSSNSCESNLALVAVTVYATPSTPVASNPSAYCLNDPASALTATSTAGNTLYWYTVPTGGTGTATAPTPSTSVAGSTNYYVANRNNTSSCEGSRTTVTVTVNPSIIASVSNSASSTSACGGGAITFTATPTNGGTPTYQWYLNNNPVGSNSATYTTNQASDNAGNYSGTWNNGSNQGSGMQAWSFNVGASTGQFIGNPSNDGNGTAGIGSTAHGLYATGSAYINTTRSLSTPMQIGDELRFYWIFNWDASAGNKGFDLRAGGSTIFNVNNAGSAAITVTGGATADGGYGTTPMYVKITRTSSSQYTFSMTRRSDGSTYTTTFNNASALDGVSFYIGGQNNGSGQRNLYFNGIELRPPSSNDEIYVAMTPTAQTCLSSTSATNSNTVTLTSSASTPTVSIQSSASTAFCPGTSVTFSVNASANMGGSPSYQWNLNGSPISGATNATLVNTTLANNDQVTLTMTSSLSGGCLTQSSATSSAITSTVSSATAISTQPAAAAACLGGSQSFTVSATGTGTLTYQWKKNGSNVTGNATATSSTLTLSGIAAGDAANYTVDVTGTCGTVSSNTAALSINPATAISAQPSAVTQCAGTTANFSVTASGQGTLTYQWRKDGSALSGETNATLAVTNITSANAGQYSVIVSGGCGNLTSSNALLTINSATVISTQPAASTLCAGNTANFSVTASGTGTLAYQWKKDGSNVGTNSSTLSITNAQAANAGTYTVDVTATCGTVTSSNAVLVVNPLTTITTQPVATLGCQGQASTFTVVAAGTTPLSYQWKFGGVNISGATAASYTISNATAENDGAYFVTVTGGCGAAVNSNTVVLDVSPTSVGGTIAGSATVCSGTNSTTLTLSGHTGTVTKWQSSTSSTFASNVTDIANTTTSLTASNLTTTTYYRAVVANGSCSAANSATATVTVNSLPTAEISAGSATTFCSGGSVVLTASAGSSYVWKKGGVAISLATAQTYTATTAGAYTVTVTNSNSCSATSAATTVTVNALPGSATSSNVTLCGTGSVTLTATDPGTGYTINWYNPAQTDQVATASLTYTTPSISTTTTYYAEMENTTTGCKSENRTAVQAIVNVTNTFTDTSGDHKWFNTANWSCGTLPDATTNVVIPTAKTVSVYYNVNGAPAYANTIVLEGTANVTVTSDHSINVTNKVTVASGASFTVQNNASLVQTDNVANEGNIIVQKSTPSNRLLKRNDAVLWSSPVVQNLQAISTGTPAAYFMEHNPQANSWSAVSNPASANFTKGKGFLIRTPSTFTTTATQQWSVNFTGVPNNGNVTLSAGSTGATEKYLLVGNPYPSAISIAAFKAGNPNITGVFYFYRKPNGVTSISGYGTLAANGQFSTNDADNLVGALTPGDVIASGQGFFVAMKSDNNNGDVFFTNAMRVANDHGHFNRVNTNLDSYKLIVKTPVGGNSQMIMNYDSETTNGYDVGYDAVAFTDGTTDFSSIMANEKYRIQSKGEYNAADVIPVQFKTGVSGEHRIKLQDAQGVFAADQMVIIKDNLTGTQHNLTANSDYVFTSATGTFTNRFEVIYQQAYYTALQANSCGATIANMSSLVYADIVNGATGYRFKVVNNTTAAVQTIDRPQHWFAFNMLSAYDYNTPYTISVQVQKDGVWTGYYGATCTVNSPNIAATGIMQINPSQCGMTLPTIGTVIATTPVAGATGYKFRITNTTANAMGNNLVQEITRTNHWFTLAMLTRYNYGSSYAIEVAVKTTGGYTAYGNACTVYAPAVPTLASCGQTVATATTLVRTTATNLATQYRFQVTRIATQETITFDTANYWFSFRVNVPGYAAGEQYGVRVAVMTAGAWSPYGDACDITAPIATARTTEEAAPSEANLFKPVAYPNPFKSEFSIALATPFKEDVTLVVYDLQGRLIEKQTVPVTLIDTIHIGANYQMGDYMLVVSQGPAIESMLLHKE